MSEKRTFSEVERFWFHHGGVITLPEGKDRKYKTINEEIVSRGWRLVGKEEIRELLENNKQFLYRQEGYLIGTKKESIITISAEDEDEKVKEGDLLVPAIHPQENDLRYIEKLIIRGGLIYDHSDIYVLAVK